MRKIFGLTVFVCIAIPHAFAGEESFINPSSTGAIIRNTHKNIPTHFIVSTGTIIRNNHRNIPRPKPIANTWSAQAPIAANIDPTPTTWTGLISPTERAIIDRLSDYAVPRSHETDFGDRSKGLAFIFLATAVFLFCVELFTGRLFALAISIAGVGMSLWMSLANVRDFNWIHTSVFLLAAAILIFLLPRVVRSYAEDLGMIGKTSDVNHEITR